MGGFIKGVNVFFQYNSPGQSDIRKQGEKEFKPNWAKWAKMACFVAIDELNFNKQRNLKRELERELKLALL